METLFDSSINSFITVIIKYPFFSTNHSKIVVVEKKMQRY